MGEGLRDVGIDGEGGGEKGRDVRKVEGINWVRICEEIGYYCMIFALLPSWIFISPILLVSSHFWFFPFPSLSEPSPIGSIFAQIASLNSLESCFIGTAC